jgi:hypothetical protein
MILGFGFWDLEFGFWKMTLGFYFMGYELGNTGKGEVGREIVILMV